ncbi:hypothetical protein pETSU_176 [Edwardsiella phage pEt-SU]|uniref:Uncharacterized protein n=1 Tax=Edwardsiella phage pEt-SU TaxID=2562142 RepID=A0A4D6DWL4_9CAUD|nr:hypothetical protein HOV39_gp176 [Edwardsiella phage pEt-SU]QBZ70757.1 hypothetical protein pETSU_176 [Edwardsiella phage pEt-SU]
MINQILSALRISLKECKKYEDPAEYIYQINQVLNRYKTNLFKMIPDKEQLAYDPKELFNIQIKANWRCSPDYKRRTSILDHSPVMLHFIGFLPIVGVRLNLEKNVSKAIDISDIIDLDRINGLKTDYYSRRVGDEGFYNEETIMENTIGFGKADSCSLYWTADRAPDDIIVFNFQVNAKVHDSVIDKYNLASAAAMAIKDGTPRQMAIQKALEDKLLNKGTGAHYTEIHEDQPMPVGGAVRDFFGLSPESSKDRKTDFTMKPKKTNAGVPRKKHNFW